MPDGPELIGYVPLDDIGIAPIVIVGADPDVVLPAGYAGLAGAVVTLEVTPLLLTFTIPCWAEGPVWEPVC